jgi:hypothetical protein
MPKAPPLVFGPRGEAHWLAGVLLITAEDAALAIVRNGLSVEDAAMR